MKTSILFFVLFVFYSFLEVEAAQVHVYDFSYRFESGGILSGTFNGMVTPQSNDTVFNDTITVLPSPMVAIYRDSSGIQFEWDTSLTTDTSSQTSLISPNEVAFVSSGGLKMDFALSSDRNSPSAQIFLENGINGSGASIINLPGTMLIEEPFLASNWNMSVVPIPASIWLFGFAATGLRFLGLRRNPTSYSEN